MGEPVEDARKAVEVAKDYAKASMQNAFWKDVVECEFDEKTGYWRVVFLASPGLLDPYHRYEVFIDSKTGVVKRHRRIEK
jgi:hypothetical protein